MPTIQSQADVCLKSMSKICEFTRILLILFLFFFKQPQISLKYFELKANNKIINVDVSHAL